MDGGGQLVVFYDGECPFCIGWVKFLVDRDGADRLRFAALQGDWAQRFFAEQGLEHPGMESLVVWDGIRLLTRATALRQLAAVLPGGWRLVGKAFGWLPERWQDGLYRFVAARRYRWFGRLAACWVPDAPRRRKFLDSAGGPANGGAHADASGKDPSAHPRQGHL